MQRLTNRGSLFIIFTAAALCVLLPLAIQGAPLPPTDNEFGRTCNYTAKNISTGDFFVKERYKSYFPLEDELRILDSVDQPWKLCFGSSEPYDLEAIRAGKKLPCFYTRNQWGTVDYWEEHVCEQVSKTNCYCYALNRYIGGYCQPGAATLEHVVKPEYFFCDWYKRGLIADGGVQVDRDTVYSKAPKGHYVALATEPPGLSYKADYHFWRLDSDGSWANKPGAHLPRRTYGDNNAKITDVEDVAVRGIYSEFCGYFEVFPDTHKLTSGPNNWNSRIPTRFERWDEIPGMRKAALPLDSISRGWRIAYKKFWQTSDSDTVADGGAEGSRRLLYSSMDMKPRPGQKPNGSRP
jgi:hypothetical protein